MCWFRIRTIDQKRRPEKVAPVDEAAPVVDDDVHPDIAADATAVIVFFVITFMPQVNARRSVK